MYPTAEVRWFTEGPLPDAVEAWFREVAGEGPREARTDHYVRPASPDGLGVKGRTGNLEVKRLARVVGTEALREGVVGRVECWRKWSFPLGETAVLHNATGDWVAVAKERQKGTFAIREGGVERVRREEQVGQGCSLEVATVQTGEQRWWSVSLEAFGSYREAALVAYLRAAADTIFRTPLPVSLPDTRSMSYPAWLWQLSKGTTADVHTAGPTDDRA